MRGEWWWPTSFAQALCSLPLHTNLHASLIKLFHKRHYNAPFHVTKRKGGVEDWTRGRTLHTAPAGARHRLRWGGVVAGLCRRGSQQRLITTLFQQFNVLVRSRRGRSPCEVKEGGAPWGQGTFVMQLSHCTAEEQILLPQTCQTSTARTASLHTVRQTSRDEFGNTPRGF